MNGVGVGFRLVKWVQDEAPSDLTHREIATLSALARWCKDETGYGNPWREQVARGARTSEKEVKYVLSALRRKGLIVRKGGGYRGAPVMWRFAHYEKGTEETPSSS